MLSPFVDVDPVKQRIDTGANWFYWIAGLTLMNSAAGYSGSSWGFGIGLGTTQVLDYLASSARLPGVALGIDAFVILTCAIVGLYARESRVVYIAGMIAYGLDTLIFLAFRDIFGLALHGFALWNLFRGVRAFGDLKARTRPPASERPVAVGAAGTAS